MSMKVGNDIEATYVNAERDHSAFGWHLWAVRIRRLHLPLFQEKAEKQSQLRGAETMTLALTVSA